MAGAVSAERPPARLRRHLAAAAGSRAGPAMPHFQAWEEFTRAAEKLYLADPMKCLLYRTDQAQDVKKIEKFHSQLMRLMVAKESRSAAMETD
uniref:Signal recognition particle 9 n=1 Tax=Catharus ustulatus TaxID=91951 RepID=A0A8C3UFA0_CATUS